MYQTGNIVKSRINKLPFIYHYGIIVMNGSIPVIMHFSPNGVNSRGGSLHVDRVEAYLKTRTLVSVTNTTLTNEQIEAAYNGFIEKKFNLITRNCEHFVNQVAFGKARSKQVENSFMALLAIIIIITVVSKIRKK